MKHYCTVLYFIVHNCTGNPIVQHCTLLYLTAQQYLYSIVQEAVLYSTVHYCTLLYRSIIQYCAGSSIVQRCCTVMYAVLYSILQESVLYSSTVQDLLSYRVRVTRWSGVLFLDPTVLVQYPLQRYIH